MFLLSVVVPWAIFCFCYGLLSSSMYFSVCYACIMQGTAQIPDGALSRGRSNSWLMFYQCMILSSTRQMIMLLQMLCFRSKFNPAQMAFKFFFFLRLQLHMWTAIAACMFIICKKKLCRWQVGSKWWTFAQYSLRLFSLDSLLVHSWVQSVWQQTLHNYTLQILEGACFVRWCKYFFFPLLIYLLIRATFNSFISKV